MHSTYSSPSGSVQKTSSPTPRGSSMFQPETPKTRNPGSSRRQQVSRTPSRQQQQEPQVTCSTPTGRTTGINIRRVLRSPTSTNNPFAGNKFTESPSARSLPMPPSDWLDELCTGSSSSSCDSDCGSSVISSHSSMSSSASVVDMEMTPPASPSFGESRLLLGQRLNPMQLIAAVATA